MQRRNFLSMISVIVIIIIKETGSVISSDPQFKKDNVRFTTVLLKTLCVRRVQRYVCVNLSKPACIQLQIPVC